MSVEVLLRINSFQWTLNSQQYQEPGPTAMEDIQASFSQLQVSMLENELIQTFLDPIEEIIQESREY